jgi:mannan endo-1,4-beta-mannosidase
MLQLILAFTSNWTPTGGIPEYLKWAGATSPLQFYTEAPIKDMYKAFVQTVIARVNTINGRTYRDDPTIMAWNLINEPRCKGCPNGAWAAV